MIKFSKHTIRLFTFISCVVFQLEEVEELLNRKSDSDIVLNKKINHYPRSLNSQHSDVVVENRQMVDTFTGFIMDSFHYLYGKRRLAGKRQRYSKYDIDDEVRDTCNCNSGDKYKHATSLIFKNVLNTLDGMYIEEDVKNVTSKCISDTRRLIVGLLTDEYWTDPFLDSIGKPGPALANKHLNFVGDYKECIAATAPTMNKNGNRLESFKGNYCVVAMYLGNSLFVPQIGVCLSNSCNTEEVNNLINKLIHPTWKRVIRVECRNTPTEATIATILSIGTLAALGVMIMLGTLYDLVIFSNKETQSRTSSIKSKVENFDLTQHEPSMESGLRSQNLLNCEQSPSRIHTKVARKILYAPHMPSTITKVFLAFSLYSNGKRLLNTSHSAESLSAIYGIRSLCMIWIVIGHTYRMGLSRAINLLVWLPELLKRWELLPLTNGFVAVDTFFTLSGFLTSYLTIKEMSRRNSWKINWSMYYFHRFWRLTPPYMFSMVIFLGLTQYLGEGPLWGNVQPLDKKSCEKNWWTNLLYINNLVKTDEMCFAHSWYIANEIQFLIVSPLLLIPLYLNHFAGVFSCITILLTSMITTGVLSLKYNLPTTCMSVQRISSTFSSDYFNNYYIKPWCRIGPFVVGILAGYVLTHIKNKKSEPLIIPWSVIVTGWIFSFVAGLACIFGIYGDTSGENVSSTEFAAFYNATSRTAWGVCVSWVILACSTGNGGPIQTLLSWPPFVFLGRLSYMSYLIQLSVLNVFFGNLDSLFYLNDTVLVVICFGLLVVIIISAFIFVLVLESPIMALEKAFLKTNSNNKS